MFKFVWTANKTSSFYSEMVRESNNINKSINMKIWKFESGKKPLVKPSTPIGESNFMKSLTETTVSFSEATSIHGINQIVHDCAKLGSTRSSRQEKLTNLISLSIWLSSLVFGAIFAITMMNLVWERFQTTPTITTVDTNNYPIWNIDFPAVTICNNNKVYEPATKNITNILQSSGISESQILAFYRELAKLVSPEYVEEAYRRIYQLLYRRNYTTERLMFELMQPCTDLIQNCSWLGSPISCDIMFRVAKSSEGFCCSFNYRAPFDVHKIDTMHDYVEDNLEPVIRRVSGAGPYVGLDALIQIVPHAYLSYTKSFYGVSVLIHGAQEFPQSADKSTIGQPGNDVRVAIIPSIVVSEASIRSLPISQRNCYFDDERKLRTTSKYTYQSCISECAVDTILSICNCLPFYYAEVHLRNFVGRNRQCTLDDVNCLRDNRHIFSSLQPDDSINETLGMSCECKPSCSEETFTIQPIIANRYPTDNLPSTLYEGINLTNYVTLKVHFKNIACIKYRRDVFLTWDALFASFGGIFGLCLGGSIISLVEFVYYFTFKLYQNFRSRQLLDNISNNTTVNEQSIIVDARKSKVSQHLMLNNKFNKRIPAYKNNADLGMTIQRRMIQMNFNDQDYYNYDKKYGGFLN